MDRIRHKSRGTSESKRILLKTPNWLVAVIAPVSPIHRTHPSYIFENRQLKFPARVDVKQFKRIENIFPRGGTRQSPLVGGRTLNRQPPDHAQPLTRR